MKKRGANGEKPSATILGPDHFTIPIVGESFYMDALTRLLPVDREIRFVDAILVPEPDNPYGADAVRIDIDAKTVGHLPKEITYPYHHRLEEAGHPGEVMLCRAAIRGRPRGEHASGRRIGVWLDLPYSIGQLEIKGN